MTDGFEITQAIVDRLNGIPPKVWVASITNDYGTTVAVHISEHGARSFIADYCREWWKTELGDEPMLESDHEVIREYFDRVEEESYDIQQVAVEP